MHRVLEIIFGLQRGFLSREGDFTISFHSSWPWQSVIGAGIWNLVLGIGALALVIGVYRRDGRSRKIRILLGTMRATLMALVIMLLNRPLLVLTQTHTEPSVLPILVDDSLSMRIADAGGTDQPNETRLAAAIQLLQPSLLGDLAKAHDLKPYAFDMSARPLPPTTIPSSTFESVKPFGQSTNVGGSIRSALDDLQGQHLAGVVVLTDGRDTPAQPLAPTLAALQDSGVKVFPVVVGSPRPPTNLAIQSVVAEDSAFKGDIVNIRASVRGTGYEPGKTVLVELKNKKTGLPMTDPSGKPAQSLVTLTGEDPVLAELQFKPDQVGDLDLEVAAAHQPGETDEEDNSRELQMSILDAKLNVLYVDGYPRWEYRYLKTEMIRDPTVDISCLLTSADPNFAQEGDRPITRFPETIQELLDYDVVIFGDVDPRQFSDAQLQLVNDFVAKRGGGFGMVAGPKFAPIAYRGTPIESILPVNISRVQPDMSGPIVQSFRPLITETGLASSIFRFFPDRTENDNYLKTGLQPLYWYCHGITTKAGTGEVYAEHPTESAPDGRRAPILVLGRYGAGRTLFSAIDDSWRWRYQSGESVFDVYWVQQLRQLARSRKLGQRRFTLTSARPTYDLGDQVRLTLRMIDPQLAAQLPDTIRADVLDSVGQLAHQETFRRQESDHDTFTLSFAATQLGKFDVKLATIPGTADQPTIPIAIGAPRLELAQPQIDTTSLAQLADQTHGKLFDLSTAAAGLRAIPSAAKIIPVESSQPLWDAPLALILFAILLTTEWIVRKAQGMV